MNARENACWQITIEIEDRIENSFAGVFSSGSLSLSLSAPIANTKLFIQTPFPSNFVYHSPPSPQSSSSENQFYFGKYSAGYGFF